MSEGVIFQEIKSEAEKILQASANKVFKGKQYGQSAVATWISQFNEDAITNLNSLN